MPLCQLSALHLPPRCAPFLCLPFFSLTRGSLVTLRLAARRAILPGSCSLGRLLLELVVGLPHLHSGHSRRGKGRVGVAEGGGGPRAGEWAVSAPRQSAAAAPISLPRAATAAAAVSQHRHQSHLAAALDLLRPGPSRQRRPPTHPPTVPRPTEPGNALPTQPAPGRCA